MRKQYIPATIAIFSFATLLYFASSYWHTPSREKILLNADYGKLPVNVSLQSSKPLTKNHNITREIKTNSEPMVAEVKAPNSTNDNKTLIQSAFVHMEADPENLVEVQKLLGSAEGKARESAAVFLAKTGSGEAVSMLLKAIKTESDSSVRENLIECLRTVSNPSAIPILAAQAQDLSDLALHRICRNAMSSMADPVAISQLIVILDKSGTSPSSEPLAYAVAHMNNPNAINGLLEGTISDNERVAKASIQGLGNLANADAYLALLELTGKYENTDRGQLASAVATQTMIEKKDDSFIEVCLNVIEATQSLKEWQTAIDGLVAIPSPKALSALEKQSQQGLNGEILTYLQNAITRHKKLWPPSALLM